MDWSSAGPLWQRQSAGESRWARTEAVGEGRATSPTSLQPRVTQMYELLMQLATVFPPGMRVECMRAARSGPPRSRDYSTTTMTQFKLSTHFLANALNW